MILGYMRGKGDVATAKALTAAGAEQVRVERTTKGRWDHPELDRLIEFLRPGDVVLVDLLSTLSRSLKDVLLILRAIDERGAGVRSLADAVDTTEPGGETFMRMVRVFLDFDHTFLRERVREGLEAARREGRTGGRKPKLSPEQEQEIVRLVSSGEASQTEAAKQFGVHRSTVNRLLTSAPPAAGMGRR